MLLTSEIVTSSNQAIRAGGAHLFWSGNIQESLRNSITEFGQSAPVLVRETERGLELVAGASRLALLTELGRPVLARLVEAESPVELGLLYLADNAHREPDDAMRIRALRHFAPHLDRDGLERDILPRLGVRPKSKDGRLLLDWLALPEAWQDLLAGGNVPLAAGTVLARMTDADRDAVAGLFGSLSWSRSNAVNVLTWLFEAGRMTGASVTEVMERASMHSMLGGDLSPKDAIARLCTAARQIRYPELTRLRDRFDGAARTVTAGTRWRLTQPDNFETSGAELTVRVKDAGQLAAAVEELNGLAGSPAWKDVFNPGGDDA
ncbi:ParB N-terminal domain-containing protein [Pseudodesulfovibrio indicus]|uniref:ParB/RepB/Spo0J family partition protein n=1 Tax=Pseudodesulfovibrio indicus TaxID=1716143 RepID=UPI0029319345|nr:ParB N-terminal domain-containing protein [Pseudodesulfovibrio indicus]